MKDKIYMRMNFSVARPSDFFSYRPKIDPIVYKRPIKEQWFILKKIGIKDFINLWKFERLAK